MTKTKLTALLAVAAALIALAQQCVTQLPESTPLPNPGNSADAGADAN